MQMLRTHPDIQPIEYPFVDTYYFGHESLTRRKNAKMEATRQKFQSDPSLIHTYQEAFNLLKESIDSAQDMVPPLPTVSLDIELNSARCYRERRHLSKSMPSLS